MRRCSMTTGNSMWGLSRIPPDPSPLPFHTPVPFPFLPPPIWQLCLPECSCDSVWWCCLKGRHSFSQTGTRVTHHLRWPTASLCGQCRPFTVALTGLIPSFHEIIAIWHINPEEMEIHPDWGRSNWWKSSALVTSVEERQLFCPVIEQDKGQESWPPKGRATKDFASLDSVTEVAWIWTLWSLHPSFEKKQWNPTFCWSY